VLERLRVPERLWALSPVTFSGGEQQRVNVARVFVADYPILLLDEPTASLDAVGRLAVVELIREARARGAAVLGIVHDAEVRAQVATRVRTLAGTEAA
jgi:alpha-D-ribose 1-methylphosphonate 5-triphosphate synthase subunit PhnL